MAVRLLRSIQRQFLIFQRFVSKCYIYLYNYSTFDLKVRRVTRDSSLMFRINTFEVHLPPLRDRIEDIAELSLHLLNRLRFGEKNPSVEMISEEAIQILQKHLWPGNVRELANVIEHATILGGQPPILSEHLPDRFEDRKLRESATLKFDKPRTFSRGKVCT